MNNCFITVRFDRMKNLNLKVVYKNLLDSIKYLENDSTEIKNAINRLQSYQHLTKVLDTKPRKKLYTAEITKLRTHNDKLIAAIQFQYKALAHAKFDEDASPMLVLNKHFAELLANYKSNSVFQKKIVFKKIESHQNNNSDFKNALTELGFRRYLVKLNENNEKIKQLEEIQKGAEKELPAPNTTQPNKEKLFSEMRFYMRTIEIYFQTHPEIEEKVFVNFTNNILKEARTQLRNTTTRRLRRKEKADKKLASEMKVETAENI